MKIMVSLDGSESSMRALDFITSRPWAEDDQFMIVSVVEPDKGDMSMAQAMTNPDEVFFANAEKLLANVKDKFDVAFLAVNKKGEHGGFSTKKGFTYCVTTKEGTKVITSKSWF